MRIMIISTVGLIYDGITNVILSTIEAMDRSDLDIYIVETIRAEKSIKNRFAELGCKIVSLPDRRSEPVKYFNELKKAIQKNKIDVIHANGNSATLTVEMIAALLGGCKKRIAHSHNTKCDWVKTDKILRPFFYHTYTDALACGTDAGRWLFKDRPFTVVKNGRNIEKYRFDPVKRELMRRQLGIEDKLAVAHVGGFFAQKNHELLIRIFASIADMESDAVFYIVGDGILKDRVIEQVRDLGLEDRVIFTGDLDNVNDYLQAFDIMLLPSLFEGLPLAAVEWQLCGLPCLFSDRITRECVLFENVRFCSIDDPAGMWAKEALKLDRNNREKFSDMAIVEAGNKGYDINDSARILKSIYIR